VNLKNLADAGKLRFAGPLRTSEGTPAGSIVLFEAHDLKAARAIAEADPYKLYGVFDSVEVFETLQVFPED
jgi:uncharacterized protein YciI